jgi:hypothetical protein
MRKHGIPALAHAIIISSLFVLNKFFSLFVRVNTGSFAN